MWDVFKSDVNAYYILHTTQYNAIKVFCKLAKLPEINAGYISHGSLTSTTAAANCHRIYFVKIALLEYFTKVHHPPDDPGWIPLSLSTHLRFYTAVTHVCSIVPSGRWIKPLYGLQLQVKERNNFNIKLDWFLALSVISVGSPKVQLNIMLCSLKA